MPSTAATEPDFANSRLNLVACLALYQHRQDKAIGIEWVSERTRGLLWYYGLLQTEQLAGTMQATYLNYIIQKKVEEIKHLAAIAKEAENKQEILKKAIELEKEINIAKAMLDQLMVLASPE